MISLTSPVRTSAHSWPAGAKLAGLCAATMGLFALDDLIAHTTIFISILLLYAVPGRVFLIAGVRGLTPLWPFLALLALWHAATGTPAAGAVVALRLLSAVMLANLVTMTTRLTDMIAVVTTITGPLRRMGVKTRGIELAIALVIRFTPALTDKGTQLARSWRARSRRRPGWRIVAPFTLLAIDDAEHVAEALKARGGL